MADEKKNKIAKRKGQLIEVSGRDRSLTGWSFDLFEDHLLKHNTAGGFCDVSCASRTFFGRDTEANRAKVRRRLTDARRKMIDRGRFLYVSPEVGGHRRALRFKVFNGKTEEEIQGAHEQLEAMRNRGLVSAERYRAAQRILEERAGLLPGFVPEASGAPAGG